MWEGCGAAFVTRAELKKHSRVHTGERPYWCGVGGCEARFAHLKSCKAHRVREHG